MIQEECNVANGRFDYWIGRIKHYSVQKHQSITQPETPFNKPKIIAFPEPRKLLKKELCSAHCLGKTNDGKKIYLVNYHQCISVMREIGRLREISFRTVGEGTNKSRDLDDFDKVYRHIVLWDEIDQEIVGAYRIGEAGPLYQQRGLNGLYTSRLFHYQTKFIELFPEAVELGRSFVQPRYWGKRSLDYLWTGIGAYLSANQHIRYIFGAVSISNDYPDLAKSQIIECYQHYFQPEDHQEYAVSTRPFVATKTLNQEFKGNDYATDFKRLKRLLAEQTQMVPTLYKQYADFSEPGGTQFIDFNIDPSFSNCVDSLVLTDLQYTKDKKRKRYIDVHA